MIQKNTHTPIDVIIINDDDGDKEIKQIYIIYKMKRKMNQIHMNKYDDDYYN